MNIIKKSSIAVLSIALFNIIIASQAKADIIDTVNQAVQGYVTTAVSNPSDITTAVSTITNPSAVTAKAPAPVKTYLVTATGYDSSVDETDSTPFITADGSYVHDGIIAANFLPFGTVVKIPALYGDKIFTVDDRMNSRYWYNVDIWFPSKTLAKNFGAKKVEIEIIS